MTTKKSVLILFLFLLASMVYEWFFQVAPLNKFQELVTQVPTQINQLVSKYYAPDLVISIDKGKLSLNRPSPYCFLLDEKEKIGILYDQKAVASPKAFEKNGPYQKYCQPVALVGQDFWMVPDKNSSFKVEQIPETLTLNITKTDVDKFVSTYLPIVIRFGTFGYWVLPIIIVLFMFGFFLLNNLWYAFVTRLILKLFKVASTASYGEVYYLTLFFYSLLLFIYWFVIGAFLNGTLGLNVEVSFPFLNTILIALGAVLYYKSKPGSVVFTSTPAPKSKTKVKS